MQGSLDEKIRLEDGNYGRKAVLCSAWAPEMAAYLERHQVAELELNIAKGWRGCDLLFLRDLAFLRAFNLLDLTIKDVQPIHFLVNLRRLGVTTYCLTEIRFSSFPNLESCALEWRPKAASLFECKTLRTLFVNRYKGKTVESFSQLSGLESLAILNAPIDSLSGLSALVNLKSLRLGGLRCLTSLDGIQRLQSLESLQVQTCRKITSIEELAALLQLRSLFLDNLGFIKSLRPLANLSNLECLGFTESTNIVDGDLSPLLGLKRLAKVAFQNRRHYSHKGEDFRISR